MHGNENGLRLSVLSYIIPSLQKCLARVYLKLTAAPLKCPKQKMISSRIGSETSNIKSSNSFPTNEAKDNRIRENNFLTKILADDP